MNAGREMTLNEWVAMLPPTHGAKKELDALRRAAEQAKPDDGDAFAARVAHLDQDELEAEQAQAGEVCPFCGREGKHLGNEACQGLNNPTTFTLTNELPDLPEHAGTMEWTRQSGRLDIPELGYTADQMRDYANACRLAGGVTVDDAMVERAARAAFDETCRQEGIADSDAAWSDADKDDDAEERKAEMKAIMRAALVAALGAK